MKTYNYLIAILGFLTLSCGEDFLAVEPLDQLSSGNYYNSPQEIETGVIGVYDQLQSFYAYNGFPLWIELRSDDGTLNTAGKSSNVDEFRLRGSDGPGAIWDNGYELIFRSNRLLDVMENYDGEGKEKLLPMIAEVKFLRALTYFNLVRFYGDVPLVTTVLTPEESFAFGRAPASEVYEKLIINDLMEVSDVLPRKSDYQGDDVGRATRGAANALLGKVYLTLGRFDLAAASLKKVIDSEEYSLLTDYAGVFDVTNPNHAESIFEIQFNQFLDNGNQMSRWTSNELGKALGIQFANGLLAPTQSLQDAYLNNDDSLRFQVAMDSGAYEGDRYKDVDYFKKYVTLNSAPNQGTDNNYIVLRYADVLLMYAEALNETEGPAAALPFLNIVRNRAGMPAITNQDPAALRDTILNERRVELANEGHRWFDLVRTGKAIEAISEYLSESEINSTVEPFQLVFPIPQSEVDKNPNKISQNPGY